MELFGYDEDGNLAFRQGPFTFDFEAIAMFNDEKAQMAQHKVFHLSLEKTYLAADHRHRHVMSACR